jgi:hypothetical protein
VKLRSCITTFALLVSFAGPSSAQELSKGALAYGFGYVIVAQGQCDGLLVNLKTSDNVVSGLGSDPRDRGTPFTETFGKGMDAAWDDSNVCETAWDDYGCSGSKIARLIMESPFGNSNAHTCVLPVLNWED